MRIAVSPWWPGEPTSTGMVRALDQHFSGTRYKRRRRAHRTREHDAAARSDVASFHHRPVHRPQEAVAHNLRQHGKVHIDKARLASVDGRAQRGIRLIRSAEADGSGLGQRAIERRSGGSAGQHADLELAARLVFLPGAPGDPERDRLGRAGRREAAETYRLAVLDVAGSLFRRQLGK